MEKYISKMYGWQHCILNLKNSRSVDNTAQKMKFSIKDFFSKCDQIRSFAILCSVTLLDV